MKQRPSEDHHLAVTLASACRFAIAFPVYREEREKERERERERERANSRSRDSELRCFASDRCLGKSTVTVRWPIVFRARATCSRNSPAKRFDYDCTRLRVYDAAGIGGQEFPRVPISENPSNDRRRRGARALLLDDNGCFTGVGSAARNRYVSRKNGSRRFNNTRRELFERHSRVRLGDVARR